MTPTDTVQTSTITRAELERLTGIEITFDLIVTAMGAPASAETKVAVIESILRGQAVTR